MRFRISFLVAATVAAAGVLPVTAAQYEKTGNWVFDSKAFAEDGDAILYDCVASTVAVEGTELALKVAPGAEGGFDAGLTLTNDAWALDQGPVRVRFDIGADHWVLPGQGDGKSVDVSWTGDAAFLTFIEDLASSSFAGLSGRDGSAIAQFSLTGSRSAIEAMKACGAEQIGQGLADTFGPAAPDEANPF